MRYHITAIGFIGVALVLSLAGLNLHGQYYYSLDQNKIDSLESLLVGQEYREPDILIQLSELYARYDSSMAMSYAREALRISMEEEDVLNKGRAYSSLAMNDHLAGHYSESASASNRAIALLEPLEEHHHLAVAYERLAFTHFWAMSDRDIAVRYMLKALEFGRKSGDSVYVARIHLLLAGGLMRMQEYQDALFHARESTSLAERYPVPRLHRAIGYAVIGDILGYVQDYRGAIYNYWKAIRYYDTSYIEDKSLLAQSYGNMARYFYELKYHDSSYYYLEKKIELALQVENTHELMRYHSILADNLFKENRWEESASHYHSLVYWSQVFLTTGNYYHNPAYQHFIGNAIDIFDPVSKALRQFQAWELLKSAYGHLIQISRNQGNEKQALEYYRKFSDASDTIRKRASSLELMALQEKFETDRKEKELESLRRDNEERELLVKRSSMYLVGLVILAILIVATLVLLFVQFNLRARQRDDLLKQKLFRLQVNPVFLFGALGSIRSYMEKEEPKKVSVYLGDFSRLLRNVLEGSRREFVRMEDDLNTIKSYLDLQKLRLGERLDYSLEVDDGIDTELIEVPPLLSHPSLEYLVRVIENCNHCHQHITIHYQYSHFELRCEIKGKWVSSSNTEDEEKENVEGQLKEDSYELTRHRLKSIDRSLKNKVRMHSEAGTSGRQEWTITFSIPFRHIEYKHYIQ